MSLSHTVSAKARSMLATLLAMASFARNEWAPAAPDPDAHPVQRAAQVGTIISVVVVGIVALVGVLIFDQVFTALPTTALYQDGAAQTEANRTALGNSSFAVVDGFSGAMELVPVVLLVLIAALVIGVVQRMRMN